MYFTSRNSELNNLTPSRAIRDQNLSRRIKMTWVPHRKTQPKVLVQRAPDGESSTEPPIMSKSKCGAFPHGSKYEIVPILGPKLGYLEPQGLLWPKAQILNAQASSEGTQQSHFG